MFKTVGGGGGRGVHCIDILNAPPTKLTRGKKKKKKKEKMSKNFEEVRRSLTMTDVMLLTSNIAHLPD